ncbi:MAG TPA: DUF4159 domain-containing protein [Chitinophagales bacterium]|jgi:hypothetical protein|nr:DUF4159 domain-containing protein [Chitinophagales bacterium]HQW79038.1 DUF4159 domain-containing protein [Chitinophagales bacterium]HRB67754.1 DUF4159 domain-containing protein [Chitinophagales bacterium]HRB69743.1 DUF4159 domain-containing protein [Chitinophagales bacterium]
MKHPLKLVGILFLLLSQLSFNTSFAQVKTTAKIGLLKYKGGGDWYANPTALPNLASFCNQQLHLNISKDIAEVEPGSTDLFNFPFIHITGHGNIIFSDQEADNLRTYLMAGGFLHISDNYGMDKYIRKAMKKVFPELDFIELSASHPIYHQTFDFPNGLPKIHEHDNKPAQGFGLIYEGRLVCFYDYQCDLGDGWEDASVHKDSEETRLKALKMGANMVQYAFTK